MDAELRRKGAKGLLARHEEEKGRKEEEGEGGKKGVGQRNATQFEERETGFRKEQVSNIGDGWGVSI